MPPCDCLLEQGSKFTEKGARGETPTGPSVSNLTSLFANILVLLLLLANYLNLGVDFGQ